MNMISPYPMTSFPKFTKVSLLSCSRFGECIVLKAYFFSDSSTKDSTNSAIGLYDNMLFTISLKGQLYGGSTMGSPLSLSVF